MKRALILVAVLAAPGAGAAYRCVDDKGNTHIGDTPPAACASVVMYEVSKSGQVLRRIDPTPTPEQARLKDLEAARRKEAEKAAAEQKRKDLTLLSTYAAEREFDVARDRNIEPIRVRIVTAQERIAAVEKRQKQIEEEMEFYTSGKSRSGKAREVPPQLLGDLERSRAEKKALLATIASNEKEIEQIKARYDGDKQRWMALKNVSAKPVQTAPAADAKATKGY